MLPSLADAPSAITYRSLSFIKHINGNPFWTFRKPCLEFILLHLMRCMPEPYIAIGNFKSSAFDIYFHKERRADKSIKAFLESNSSNPDYDLCRENSCFRENILYGSFGSSEIWNNLTSLDIHRQLKARSLDKSYNNINNNANLSPWLFQPALL